MAVSVVCQAHRSIHSSIRLIKADLETVGSGALRRDYEAMIKKPKPHALHRIGLLSMVI